MSITMFVPDLRKALGLDYPLLMLDCLMLDSEAKTATGRKVISVADPVFAGHFPGMPILPGVQQVAGMCQAATLLGQSLFPAKGRLALVGLERVKFRKPVLPGHVLQTSVTFQQERADGSLEFQAAATHSDGQASAGTILLATRDDEWFRPQYQADWQSPLAANFPAGKTDALGLEKILPHRRPFLLADGAYGLADLEANCIYGYKNLSGADPLLQASADSTFPGWLHPEVAAQLGCAYLLQHPENQGRTGIFLSIDKAVFHYPAFAGEQLQMKITCIYNGRAGSAEAIIYSGNRLVSEISIKFLFVDKI